MAKKRARNKKGQYKADDPKTLDKNEAWEEEKLHAEEIVSDEQKLLDIIELDDVEAFRSWKNVHAMTIEGIPVAFWIIQSSADQIWKFYSNSFGLTISHKMKYFHKPTRSDDTEATLEIPIVFGLNSLDSEIFKEICLDGGNGAQVNVADFPTESFYLRNFVPPEIRENPSFNRLVQDPWFDRDRQQRVLEEAIPDFYELPPYFRLKEFINYSRSRANRLEG